MSFRWFIQKSSFGIFLGIAFQSPSDTKIIPLHNPLSPLTVGHISCATVTCDYRNICKIPHAELNGMIALGSGQAGCNLTPFQLHCCISAVLSQILDLMNGWCWITSKVKRGFPLHAWYTLRIYVSEQIVWDIVTSSCIELPKYWSVVQHLFEFTWFRFRRWRGI